MRSTLALALAAPAALALVLTPAPARAAPNGVAHAGAVTSEARRLPPFQAVRLAFPFDLVVEVGPAQSVIVTVDRDLHPWVVARVEDGTLVLDAERPFRNARTARVEVSVPALRRLVVDGSGDARVEGGAGPLELSVEGSGDVRWRGEASTLDVAVEGSGDVRLAGRAQALRVRMEGSGNVRARELAAVDADVVVNGSADVELKVAGGKLAAVVHGSGDVRWDGTASQEQVAVDGSGSVTRR